MSDSKSGPHSISTLLTRNITDVFGENDPARRRATINEIYTEDCVFYDPMKNAYRGRDEIDRIAGQLRAMHPDFVYKPLADPEEVGNSGRMRWVEGSPRGAGSELANPAQEIDVAPTVAGTDFIIARDGRIAAIYLFFDKLP